MNRKECSSLSRKFLPILFISLILILGGTLYLHSNYHTICSAGIALMECDANYQVTVSPIHETVSCSVDLANVEANIVKVVYDDGQCQIKIANMINENDSYKIYFDAKGTYDFYKGTLVTLLSHNMNSVDGYIRTSVKTQYTRPRIGVPTLNHTIQMEISSFIHFFLRNATKMKHYASSNKLPSRTMSLLLNFSV